MIKMRTQDFTYILTIAEQQNITHAAHLLYVSQPYLTKVISRIEKELDIKLFNRSTTPITLTNAGVKYVEYCRRFIELEKELKETFSTANSQQLRIGVPPVRGSYFLPRILPSFAKIMPKTYVEILEISSNLVAEKIANGVIDLGIFACSELRNDIINEKLFDERILLMLPQGHRLYYEATFDTPIAVLNEEMFNILNGDNFISIDSPKSITKQVIEYFARFNVFCNIGIASKNNVTTYRLCEMGMGSAIIMEAAMRNTEFYNKPCFWQIGTQPLTVPWYISYRKGEHLTDAQKLFLNLIKENINEILSTKKEE